MGIINTQAVADGRKVRTGKDGALYNGKGKLLATVEVFQAQMGLSLIHIQMCIRDRGVGAWVNPLSGKPEEYEFLLNRGTDFLVTDIGQDGADTIIRMKVTGRTETEWSYATKEEVIEQWKRRGVYSEESAKLL